MSRGADGKKGTFMTSVSTTELDSSLSASLSDSMPESMKRVKALHQKLSGVVNQLDMKVSGVLEKQEKEFLGAYRAHMYTVQKELQTLRARCEDAEMSLKKNEKISKLEEARDWFREEAQRLDRILQSMRKSMQHMQEKMQTLQEDRNWLEKQLKTSKKQTKLLRAELEIRLVKSAEDASLNPSSAPSGAPAVTLLAAPTRFESAGEEDTMEDVFSGDEEVEMVTGKSGAAAGDEFFPAIGGPLPPPRSHTSTGFRRSEGTGKNAGAYLGEPSGRHSAPGFRPATRTSAGKGPIASNPVSGVESAHDKALKAKDKEIRSLRAALANERKQGIRARAAMVTVEGHKNDMEEFFIKCVEEVKASIAKRRLEGSALAGKKAGSGVGGASDAEMKNIAMSMSLEEFSAVDRKRVIEYFLLNDQIMASLYDNMFNKAATSASRPK